MHLHFGFVVGAEPCAFFPYGWHLKVSVQYTVGYVPWCVGHMVGYVPWCVGHTVGYVPWCVGRHSENSVLQSL